MSLDYAELSARSCFSFLQAASQPQELIQRAYEYSYSALALTDLNGFYGMVRAYEEARKLNFKFIVGTEIEIESCSLSFLAKDMAGYRQICRMLSEAFCDQEKSKPQFDRYQLERWILPKHHHVLLQARNFPSNDLFLWLRERFPLQQLVTKRLQPDADQAMKKWIEFLPKDIPLAWTWDVFFHEPKRYELFHILQAIRKNKKVDEIPPPFNAEAYLKPLSFLKRYRVPQKWIRQTQIISESCQFSPKEIRYHYPREWLPKGKSPNGFLRELCQKGIQERYQGKPPQNVLRQLQYELQLVKELEYEDYFLTVWDIVQFARSQGILCQGRGSAANSVICYLLGVTSIDPVEMNLLFERFVSKERDEAPDIDVDFEHERREEVIQYIYRKYGRQRAGMVATLITYRTRSALRDVGKALGIPQETLSELSKRSRWKEKVLNDSSDNPKIQRLFRLAKALKGFPRHLGQHTGGMIICQDRLDEISPIEPASMQGRSIVQWDKYDIEKLGLLKIDVLGLGMLTCIQKSFELLRKHKIADLELYKLPANDSKTYDMICQSKTVGVFQIESRAQMGMLPRLRPRCFYDLVIEVAIIRPGPIQGGMIHPYLRRRMGKEKVSYAHPKLKPILEKTLGVPIFQEQVMKMAIDVAGYSPGEADALRRAMGAWKKTGNLEFFSADIKKRLIQNGIPPEFSERVCKQILGFGEYGFPESHAASFALLTYASCYLKAHYPQAFLCALLNSMPMGFYPFHVLTSNSLKEGVEILPVDKEKSFWDHSLEKTSQGILAVRLGLRCVKGLNREKVEKFIQKRSQGQIDLYIFDQDERSNLAMVEEKERREAYWKALAPQQRPLIESEERKLRFKEMDVMENMVADFEFTETTLKKHPALLFKERAWHYDIPLSRVLLSHDLQKFREGAQVFCFGLTQIVQAPPTAKGMVFLTLEDETGFLNLALRPNIYKRFSNIVQNDSCLLVSGKLQGKDSYYSILVTQIFPRRTKKAPVQKLRQKPQGQVKLPEPRLFRG